MPAARHRSPSKRGTYRWRLGLGLAALTTTVAAVGGATALVGPATTSGRQPASSTTTTTPETVVDEATTSVVHAVSEKTDAVDEVRALALGQMSQSELQLTSARLQAEFVDASREYEAAQRRLAEAKYEARTTARAAAEAARTRDADRLALVDAVNATLVNGPASNPMVAMLAKDPSSAADIAAGVLTMQNVLGSQVVDFDAVAAATKDAEFTAQDAAQASAKADAAEAETKRLMADLQEKASKVSAVANSSLAARSASGLYADEEQKARNEAGLRQWQAYLATLREAKVVSPTATQLSDPKDLPFGLEPVTSEARPGKPVSGVAEVRFKGQTVTVLPSETVTAVSRAFSNIGKPYVAGNAGPKTFDCSGLAAAMWKKSGIRFPADPLTQQQALHAVPVENRQVGDLLFFTSSTETTDTAAQPSPAEEQAAGADSVGIYLGGDYILTADAVSNQVGVQNLPSAPVAAARATLPRNPVDQASQEEADADLDRRCGATSTAGALGGAMVSPVKPGTYRITGQFGDPGALWSSGYHTGLDFAAPIGTPVMAAQVGTVDVSPSSWAGPNLVTIDHGDGLRTLYAHMSQVFVEDGQTVQPGQLIGAIGEEGNTTGPHLHFEVQFDKVPVDPAMFLNGSGSSAGWGGFANGMIPAEALCELATAPGQQLRCDAAHAFDAMSRAYQEDTGQPLCLTDSYRSYAVQVATFAKKPTLAAVPGTSNHGWALAVDMCGGVESFSSAAHAWMDQHARGFGWTHPEWAEPDGSRPEPWHWEFGDIS